MLVYAIFMSYLALTTVRVSQKENKNYKHPCAAENETCSPRHFDVILTLLGLIIMYNYFEIIQQ